MSANLMIEAKLVSLMYDLGNAELERDQAKVLVERFQNTTLKETFARGYQRWQDEVDRITHEIRVVSISKM